MENKNKKTYEYEGQYGTYQLEPWIATYNNNGNIAVGFNSYDKEYDCWEPFCYATVNVIPLGYLEATIDTNDNGPQFLDFLEKSGFGQRTSYVVPSGFAVYPVFKFNEDRLKEIDPKVFAEYQKQYGVEPEKKPPLADKAASAGTRPKESKQEVPAREPER